MLSYTNSYNLKLPSVLCSVLKLDDLMDLRLHCCPLCNYINAVIWQICIKIFIFFFDRWCS